MGAQPSSDKANAKTDRTRELALRTKGFVAVVRVVGNLLSQLKVGSLFAFLWYKIGAVGTVLFFLILGGLLWEDNPFYYVGFGRRTSVVQIDSDPRREVLGDLPVSADPVTEKWILHHLAAVEDQAEEQHRGGEISDFRVAFIRTGEFQARTKEFAWHLRAGPYNLSAEHAFLSSKDQRRFFELERAGGSGQELVYQVPEAAPGDYLFSVVLVVSSTGKIAGSIADIVGSIAK